jgi:hypothetical protein
MNDATNSTPVTTAQAPAKSKIQLRIEAARAALAVETKRLSPADMVEIAEREELAKVERERAEAKAVERELDLDRRLDAARDKHGPAAKFKTVMIQDGDDTFIVTLNAVAYKKWDKSINDGASNSKIDPQEERRKLVAASVVDWNGETDFGPTSLNGPKLTMYLSDHQGIVAPLIQEICILNGVVKETRKSAG